ncbi:unnamed protein product [Cladocopium goreaui]|uniref:Uncharacterized protein n=1 Tax=Cladocopium goreaui TaxID=2562237 RepID=A0A9P1FZH1_9DINO|nr:unnamed protein product [Cladocopium goreaui]
MDQLGDLPVNDQVQGAMKAFMNQMLTHMFSPDTDLSKKRAWTQHAFCEARRMSFFWGRQGGKVG